MNCFGKKNKNEKKIENKDESIEKLPNAPLTQNNEFRTTKFEIKTTDQSCNPSTSSEYNRNLSFPPSNPKKTYTDAIPYATTKKTYTPVYKRNSYGLYEYTVPASNVDSKPTNLNIFPKLPRNIGIEKPFKVEVKKSTQYFDKNYKVPTYSTHGKNRGSCLIINNIEFKKSSKRNGADVDGKNLIALFKGLGFDVDSNENLTALEMKNKLKTYSENKFLETVDINVVIMMSHGDGSRDGNTVINGTDDIPLLTADIIDFFDNDRCHYLENKPKIFIFQCCRGQLIRKVEFDTSPFIPKKKLNDMLLAYATIPGYVSHRSPELGTWYIEALCKIFMEYACKIDVENMLKMVEEKMTILNNDTGYAQTSSYENRGFKICYLHPV